MGKADDDLAVVLLCHFDYLLLVLNGGRDGLFEVERDVLGQNHLNIVKALRGGSGNDNVLRLFDIFGDLLIAYAVAVKLAGE